MERHNGGVYCTWDVAWAVARLLGRPEPVVPSWEGVLPGLERYRALGLHERTRPYQKEDILFLARRAVAILAEPMRSGKCLMSLGADVLVDSRKTLIVCPAAARLGWADEVQLWTGEAALILNGRGGREARLRCLVCRGKGYLADGADCTACVQRNGQSYGYRLYDVPELSPVPYRNPVTGDIQWDAVGKVGCTKHPEVVSFAVPGKRLACGVCQRELYDALGRARYVIVNYELLIRQHYDLGGGAVGVREDLAGWVDVLKAQGFDVAICDEAHLLRGWSTKSARRGEARNERMLELVGERRIPRVWMVTGTPFYGFVRDVFWLLEIASGGLWGRATRLRGKKFMARYCDGRKGQFGYESKGRSAFAETELVKRLEVVMMKRSKEELFADAPPIARLFKRLELENVTPFVRGVRTAKEGIAKSIQRINDLKREALMETFLAELAEGNKIIVFTFHVPSAKKAFLAFEAALRAPAQRARMREVNAKVWLATGAARKGEEDDAVALTAEQRKQWASSGDARYRLAEVFRSHPGAGVIVATIDSMPVALSLRGASSVHFLDLHWSPGAMAQAEMRPWYPEVRDLSVIYYLAAGSVDDHIELEILPKIETLARIAKEKGAEAMLQAMGHEEEERTAESVWARLTKHLHALDGEGGAEG